MKSGVNGFSHLCLPITDLDKSAAFYEKWGKLRLIDRRPIMGDVEIGRMTDEAESFVLALIETTNARRIRLDGIAHIAVNSASKEDVDERAEGAKAEGVIVQGPTQAPPGVGYSAFFVDPDGHQLEVAFKQDVGDPGADIPPVTMELGQRPVPIGAAETP